MTAKQALQDMITKAWETYAELTQEEIDGGYSDAMLSMERTEASGFAEGLTAAFTLIYNEQPVYDIDVDLEALQ